MPFINNNQFARWFRNAAPYIRLHQGKTFVIAIPDNCIHSDNINVIIEDIRLLHQLGIHVVVVHGHLSLPDHSTPITAKDIEHYIGQCAVIIQKLMAQFNANNDNRISTKNSVNTGNYINARSKGVINGVDLLHNGTVLKVDNNNIKNQLDNQAMVLMSAIGYGHQGDVYKLNFEETIIKVANAINADKLIVFTNDIDESNNHSSALYSPVELADLHISNPLISIATNACKSDIERIHILDIHTPSALLQELFSSSGYGILVTQHKAHQIRSANIDDLNSIFDLLEPLMEQGIILTRDKSIIEQQIEQYYVVVQDGIIAACAALINIGEKQNEIASIATHDSLQDEGYASLLVNHLESMSSKQGINTIIAFTTQAEQWFMRRGYKMTTIDSIPENRKARYCEYRASKILKKELS